MRPKFCSDVFTAAIPLTTCSYTLNLLPQLKSLLWIAPEHPLVITRLAAMFLWALPAVREFYDVSVFSEATLRATVVDGFALTLSVCHVRQARQTDGFACLATDGDNICMWLFSYFISKACPVNLTHLCSIIYHLSSGLKLELLIIVKWSKGQFPEPMPSRVKAFWRVAIALLVLYPTIKFGIPAWKSRQRKKFHTL